MAGAAGYESANNVKHGEMEDSFINFASATTARNAVFTDITMTNGNLSTPLRQQEDQIRALQAKLCKLKVAVATQNVEGKPTRQRYHMYDTRGKNHSGQHTLWKRNIKIRINVGRKDITPVTHTRPKHARGQTWDT